jgi:hypothetical protein
MAWGVEIRDANSGKILGTVLLSGLERQYVLSDGTNCPMCDQVAWCRSCKKFVAAEHLRALEEIDARIAAIRNGTDREPWELAVEKQLFDATGIVLNRPERVQERMDEALRWRRWRMSRTAPPKCLECGSREFNPLDSSTDISQPHPAGDGRMIRCTTLGHYSLAESLGRYSVDGNALSGTD